VLLLLALLIGLCAGIFVPRLSVVQAAPLSLVNPGDVVISEFRFLGPSGGNDEFIEIYNPKNTSIDISGLKIWGSDNTGSTSLEYLFPASTVLLSGQHYLITNNGSSGYSGSVTGDGTYSTDIADDGGIAITLADDTTIIDAVGLSIGSAYQEGTTLGSLSGISDQSYERKVGGTSDSCTDTDVNSNDFSVITPSEPQNSSSPLRLCGVLLPTLTPTNTPTSTPTLTPTPASPLGVLINEVAWAGTSSTTTADEWIELYNTGAIPINLNGWSLKIDDSNSEYLLTSFNASDVIPAHDYFLIARALGVFTYAGVVDVVVDKTFNGTLPIPDTGVVVLRLYDSTPTLVDTANLGKSSGWYAGSASPNYASMERRGNVLDGPNAWTTFGGTPFAHASNGLLVKGTPKRSNWALTITATPTRSPTPTRTPTRRPTALPVVRPVINEFLPRPGFDWNQDGKVDVFDEFIEIKNIGVIDVNLKGWKLDDEENLGSDPYTLPDKVLKPGERIVFYGLETNILLGDGGDTVRLINPSGKIYDAYTYSIAKVEDKSICRLPDGNGSWYEDCTPTPNLMNTRNGVVPSMPQGSNFESPVCDLPDTLPADFLFAECRGYGANIWHSFYWDKTGWEGDQYVPENMSKWESFVE